MQHFRIGERVVGVGHPTFIIAEIGINHNGSLATALEMIDQAAEMGVDAVKFQLRNLSSLYKKEVLENIESQDLSLQQSFEFVKKTQLSLADYQTIVEYCSSKKILFMCTPWDVESVAVLESLGVPAYKVASADLSNRFLHDRLLKTGKPMILSSGMSDQDEIDSTYQYLIRQQGIFALLHCNSTYPAAFKDIHLRFMTKMMRQYEVPIGYSGHERGISVSMAAVALGATIIERHYTLDRSQPGPDHVASLEPAEFKALVQGIRDIELSLGNAEKIITQGIIMNKQTLGKSLVATRKIRAGEIITVHDVTSKSPGKGLSPSRLSDLIGRIATRDIEPDGYFLVTDIDQSEQSEQTYQLHREWGIPVRFHDIATMQDVFQPSFLEFHWSGLDVLEPKYESSDLSSVRAMKVHVPETWQNSFLLDLCSSDPEIRKQSVQYVLQTVQLADDVRQSTQHTSKSIEFILHVGGFSTDAPLPVKERSERYKFLSESLQVLQAAAPHAVFLLENMPPLPWLLGGQRFHNIFTKSSDIIAFCASHKYKMCLDVSHAYLYCQYSGEDFYEYISKLLPFAAHLHLADASGTDGEGLQIAEGEIDFQRLLSILDTRDGNGISCIPEIWQGHNHDGEGFKVGLDRLMALGY